MRLNKLEIDNDARWFTYYTNPEDENDKVELLIGCASSADHKRMQRKLARKHTKGRSLDRFDASSFRLSEKDMIESAITLGVQLLRGWRGLEMTRGELNTLLNIPDEGALTDEEVITVEFRPDIARAILTHPGYGDILDFVTEKGGQLSEHLREQTDDIVGNSKPSSSSN